MDDELRSNFANVDTVEVDEIDIKEFWRVVRSYWRSISSIFALVLVITIYLTLTTQPVYEATSLVMIKESGTNAGSMVFDFGMQSSNQRLQNEIEVLNSYYMHDQVVQSLIEDGSANQLALFGTRYVRKRFRLADYFLEWIGRGEDTLTHPGDLNFEQRIEIVESLRENSNTLKIREADVLKISVSSSDSSEAIFLANRISTAYRNLDLAGGQGELHYILTFLDSQITKYENRLEIIEEELRNFQSTNRIYSLGGSTGLLLKDLTNYESIYYTNIAELQVANERVIFLRSQLSDSKKALMEQITNTTNPMIIALREKIAELEAQKIEQMIDEGWANESLQAKDYSRRIAAMKKELAGINESLVLSSWSEEDPFAASQDIFNRIIEQEVEVYATSSRAREYKKLVDKISAQLTNLPSQTLEYARLERDLKLNESLYLTMKQKYEESRITEAGQLGKVRILDPALIAEKIKPNKRMNLLVGMILGIGFGLGNAFLREFLDSTVKAVEHLERKGLTVLGIIPDMYHQKSKSINNPKMNPSRGGPDFRRRLITHEDPKSPISESYRSLRTNISYISADKKIKSLLVTSPQPGEGKSTTTANLAIAFAQLRKKTLLIDADLRKPVQYNVFDLARAPGLTEYLISDTADVSEFIHSTKIDNLYLLTAGGLPPNPSELLGSDRMSKLVNQLEDEWDMILFDSPPIVAVTDASMISGEIDAIALVVKAGQTERAAVDRALDVVKNVKAPLIGVILNGANPETLSGKYSYYYSYYNYYYNSENKR